MSTKRDKQADWDRTLEVMADPALVLEADEKNKNWLGHDVHGSSGGIDRHLLTGASVADMVRSLGTTRNRVRTHIQHLRDEHGLRVTTSAGSYRFDLDTPNDRPPNDRSAIGSGGRNWHEVAARTWDILTSCAATRRSLYYAEIAERLGIHHRLMTHPLELIQQHCLDEQLPRLSILVINQNTHRPGSGFTAAAEASYQQALLEVFEHDWSTDLNPFDFARDGTTEERLVARVLEGREQATEVYQRVRARGPLQRIFRAALMDAYKGRCAFSGSTLAPLLEAAHIVPWSECSPDERVDFRNGMLLSVYFHRLYDSGILKVDTSYRIEFGPGHELESMSGFDRDAVGRVVGERIRLPRMERFFPDKELLARRNGQGN